MSEAIGRRLRPETRQRLAKAAITLLFALIFLLGLCTVDDYGRNWDEKGEINIYRMALMEYGELLPFETGFHQALKAMGVIPLSQSIEMDHNSSAYYPLAPLACDPNVTDQQFTHWWRVWTWALFTLGLYALYAVCRRMGLSRPLAAAAALLALCCPRLFAQGHYNNKDAALMDLAAVVLMVAVLAFLLMRINRTINDPIQALVENTRRLAEGDFDALMEDAGENEVTILNKSFNRMAAKLQRLMEKVEEDTRTQEQLELRLLQEQINPHFLYNTLEIIVWLAESGDKEQVIQVVQSLSRFFRVVLSKGRAVVSLQEELSCIQSYLYIQKVRYADILNYEIQAEPEALDCRIQKLSLQPLVENALYHGIEKKRGGGTIRVCADVKDGCLVVQVADDGCGMTPEKLEEVQREVAGDLGQISEGGFGLPNIQKRIQLAYGADYGIHVSSRLGCGTRVTLQIPAKS